MAKEEPLMISSLQNSRIQLVRALQARRSEREKNGLFVVEGVRLCEEALAAGWKPEFVFFTDELSPRGRILVDGFAAVGVAQEEISTALMRTCACTENPQGILAVLKIQSLPIQPHTDFVLILDNIRDPGNTGSLLRSAAAAGADAVYLAPGTADLFSPKVLRSAMGAQFRIPCMHNDWDKILFSCKQICSPTLDFFLADSREGIPFWSVDFCQPLALIIGGEAEGASPEAREVAKYSVTIPMPGKVESLNAAIAGSILLFEVVRQRQTK